MVSRVAASDRWSLLPPAVKKNGDVDHDLLFQRVNICLCCLIPAAIVTYKILDACQICDPFMGSILACIPLPDTFGFIDTFRAERESKRIQEACSSPPVQLKSCIRAPVGTPEGKGPVLRKHVSLDSAN